MSVMYEVWVGSPPHPIFISSDSYRQLVAERDYTVNFKKCQKCGRFMSLDRW